MIGLELISIKTDGFSTASDREALVPYFLFEVIALGEVSFSFAKSVAIDLALSSINMASNKYS